MSGGSDELPEDSPTNPRDSGANGSSSARAATHPRSISQRIGQKHREAMTEARRGMRPSRSNARQLQDKGNRLLSQANADAQAPAQLSTPDFQAITGFKAGQVRRIARCGGVISDYERTVA